MNKKNAYRFVSFFLVVCMCFSPIPVHADGFADTATGKATTELMGGLNNFLGDWAEIQGKPLDQQLKIVRAKAAERVGQKFVEQSMGAFKKKLLEYTKARMRSDLFKEQAAKMIHDAVVDGKSISAVWGEADASVQKKVSDNMAILGEVVDGAVITYKVYDTWAKQDGSAALRMMGTEVADKIMGYFIPGWGYYRLAQAMVEALGNFVLAYAFNEALQGKIAEIAPVSPTGNPEGFANWIMTIDNISAFVHREWDEQIGVDGLYLKYDGDSKTNDDFGHDMQVAIIAELHRVKKDVIAKKKIEAEIEAKLREEEADAIRADNNMKEFVQEALKPMQAVLDLLSIFEKKYYGLQKTDAKQVVAATEVSYAEAKEAVDLSQYQPLAREKLLGLFEAMYEEITTTFDRGYDQNVMSQRRAEYETFKREEKARLKQLIVESEARRSKALTNWFAATKPYQEALKELYDEYGTSNWSKEVSERHRQLAEASNAAAQPYDIMASKESVLQNAIARLLPKEWDCLAAEEALVLIAAKERFTEMATTLSARMKDIQADLDAAYDDYQAGQEKVRKQLESNNVADFFYWNEAGEINVNMFVPMMRTESPSEILANLETVRLIHAKWVKGAQCVGGIQSLEESVHKQYELAISQAKNAFEGAVAEHNRKYPSAFSSESWNALVYRMSDDVVMPKDAVFSVSVPAGPFNAYERRDVAGFYKKVANLINTELRQLEDLEPSCELAVQYWQLLGKVNLRQYVDLKINGTAMRVLLGSSGGVYSRMIHPDESDGFQTLDAMKKDWESNRELLIHLKKIRQQYEKSAVIRFRYDPRSDTSLDQYFKIEGQIEEYEKQYVEALEGWKRACTEAQTKGALYQQEYDDIIKKYHDLRERIQPVQMLYDRMTNFLNGYGENEYGSDEVVLALKKMHGFQKILDKDIKKMQGSINAGVYVISDPSSVSGRTNYRVENFTLNGKSEQQWAYNVPLTKQDLKNGKITIEATLEPFEDIKSLSISIDSGTQWNVIPKKKKKIAYTFTPQGNNVYTLLLKIETVYAEMYTLPFSQKIQQITFNDVDLTQLVIETIGKMADSYEKQNMSSFGECISRDFLAGKTTLEEGLRLDFEMFSEARISIQINNIEDRGALMAADTRWEKTLTTRRNGTPMHTQGRTTMIFAFEDGVMKVKNLRGDLLYAVMSPEIAQASGNSQKVVDTVRKARDNRDPAILIGGGSTGATEPGTGEGSGGVGIDEPEPSDPISTNTIETGTVTLKQYSPHPGIAEKFTESFRFMTKQVLTDNDFDIAGDFRRREGWFEVRSGGGAVDMGSCGLNAVTEVPASGYMSEVGVNDGHTYALQLADGTFAVVEIVSLEDPFVMYTDTPKPVSGTFRYKYQKNGTRSMSTM